MCSLVLAMMRPSDWQSAPRCRRRRPIDGDEDLWIAQTKTSGRRRPERRVHSVEWDGPQEHQFTAGEYWGGDATLQRQRTRTPVLEKGAVAVASFWAEVMHCSRARTSSDRHDRLAVGIGSASVTGGC